MLSYWTPIRIILYSRVSMHEKLLQKMVLRFRQIFIQIQSSEEHVNNIIQHNVVMHAFALTLAEITPTLIPCFFSSHRSCIENCFFCSFVCIINWNLFHFRLTYYARVKLCEGANCIAKVYTHHRFHKNLFYNAVIVNCSKSFNNRLKTIYMKKLRVFSIDCVYINLTLQVCKLLFIIICQKRI